MNMSDLALVLLEGFAMVVTAMLSLFTINQKKDYG